MFLEKQYWEIYGFEIGFDTDDQDPQLIHICFPFFAHVGAICKTPHLWFHCRATETDQEITCPACCDKFVIIKDKIENDEYFRDLCISNSNLKKATQNYFDITYITTEYFWALTHPEEMKRLADLGDRTTKWHLEELVRLLKVAYPVDNSKFDYIAELDLKV